MVPMCINESKLDGSGHIVCNIHLTMTSEMRESLLLLLFLGWLVLKVIPL